MGILGELQQKVKLPDKASEHEGYWYSVSGVMTILACGMRCGLRLIDDWAKTAPTRAFLQARFGITRTPCRAQFYNILKGVDRVPFSISSSVFLSHYSF